MVHSHTCIALSLYITFSEEDIDDYVLRVVNENRDDKRRRESEVVEKFGPNELPTLEKVTFEVIFFYYLLNRNSQIVTAKSKNVYGYMQSRN